MAKQLNVNMKFNADSSQARRELDNLQKSLQQLISMSNMKVGDNLDAGIRSAIRSTAELSVHLQKATNIKTGNLDFTKLSQSIKSSGKSLSEYGDQLRKLGPAGQQAFMQLTQSIVQAEVPIRRTNALIKEFATTLANTARWQLSSSILHGFMGALQSAYGYAQDLNESLNNIRIVTNHSISDMANFAKEANKAAKALSTTTTAYTDASLIYFQQGLSEDEVKKRAEVTIKLANTSRQSAEEVSSQMTAIWNNFDDGSKSLEHYADVLTALGAATASSTEEISGGLEKFAGIAKTIGLSYDYAAAALATLTSNTRESEEVVGTALKTLFARIQGLSLGETLDDGTTLNKYSQALAKVGINIKDANGDLKDMDDILDAMGSKWNQLSRDQQTALAQTVAGVRQYNQLMTLMANWDNGDNDSFQANLMTARNADGTLQEQANIYADSWEAASKRVEAAAEEIYTKLLNDEFFIEVLNHIEKIIGFVNDLIDNLGGLKGVLSSIGVLMTKVLSDQMSQGLTNIAYNIKMHTKAGKASVEAEREKFIKDAANKMAKASGEGESGADEKVASKVYEDQLTRQSELLNNAHRMSEFEKETVQMLMEQLKLRGQLEIKSAQELQQKKEALSAQSELIQQRAVEKANASPRGRYNSALVAAEMEKLKTGIAAQDQLQALKTSGKKITGQQALKTFKGINNPDKGIEIVKDKDIKSLNKIAAALDAAEMDTKEYEKAIDALTQKMAKINQTIEEHAQQITGASQSEIKDYVQAVKEVDIAQDNMNKNAAETVEANKQVSEAIKNATGAQKTWSDALVATANVALSVVSAINILSSTIETLKDPDVSGWDKFVAVLTAIGVLIPTIASVMTSLQTITQKGALTDLSAALAKKKKADASNESAKASKAEANATTEATAATTADTVADAANTKVNEASNNNSYPTFGPKNRQFGNKYNKNGKPLDTSSREIGADDFQAAGLDANGKAPTTQTPQVPATQTPAPATPPAAPALPDGGSPATPPAASALPDGGAPSAPPAAPPAADGGKKPGFFSKLFGKGGGGAGLGKTIASFGIAVAFIAAAAVAVNELDKAYNKNAKSAQRAAEASAALNEEYSKASSSYNDLMNTMSNYDNAKNSLKELTKGTAEFTAQVVAANDEALKLMSEYGDIIGTDGYTVNADGVIEINEDKLEEVQKKQASEMLQAQTAATIGRQQAREAAMQNNITNFNRDKIKAPDGGLTGEDWNRTGVGAAIGTAGGAAAAAITGAVIGSSIPILGTLIGAGIGLAVGGIGTMIGTAITNNSETDAEKQIMEKLSKEYEENGESALTDANIKDLAGTNTELANQLIANKDQVRELCKEMAANTAATRAENIAMANSIVANNAEIQEHANSEYVGAFVADTYQNSVDQNVSKYKDVKMASSLFGIRTKEGEALFNEYASVAKLTSLNGYKVKNYKKDGSVVYEYIDENGQKQEATVTQEQIAATLAARDAETATTEAGKGVAKILGGMDKNVAAVLAGIKSQDMSKLSIGQLNQAASLPDDLTEAQLHTLGFTGSKNDIIEQIKAAQKNQITKLTEMANDYGATVGSVVKTFITSDNKGLKNISQETIEQYAKSMDSIVQLGGEGMASNFNSVLTSLTNTHAHQAEAIMAAANNIDWSQGEASLQEFNYQMMKLGINIDESDTTWKNLVANMQAANVSVLNNDLDSVRKKLTDIKNLTKDISFGSVLSDEDYDQLIKYNAALADSFMMTADGYMYTGTDDASEIAAELSQRQLSSLKASNERAIAGAKAASESGLNFTALANGIMSETDQENLASTLANDSENSKKIRDALGISTTTFTDLNTALTGTDEDAKKNAKAKLKEIANQMLIIQSKNEAGEYAETKADQVWASTKGITELTAARDAETIDATVANNFIKALEKQAELDKDPYREINESLEKIGENLDLIDKKKSQAFGAEHLDLIKQETDALKAQIKAEKEKIKTAQDLLNEDKTNKNGVVIRKGLKKQLIEDYNFTFDKDTGELNYDDLYNLPKDQWEAAKQVVEEYNKQLDIVNSKESTMFDLRTSISAQMLESYDAANSTLSKYISQMEHQGKLLDHYKNLMSLTGKEKDYQVLNALLEGQAKLATNNLSISKETSKMYDNEATRLKTLMDAAQTAGNNDLFKTYKQQWEAAEEKSREAQDQMLSDLQSWAESEKAILENALADLGKSLEETLTGGKSFDEVNTQMERAQSLQEEYLTTTNKVYETTKMMRTAQQAIDATSNTVAKNKLKQFITETKSMQDQNKLSQYELDMQQAKYNLLVAEIALEEAQNAKSTVRLQRDSEGNFGYVYTADSNAVAEAQQQFDDAENALYNKGLEGANNYAQKYQQTMAEMTATLQEIQSNYLAGSYESETAYQEARQNAQDYYMQQLQSYTDLYGVATKDNTNIINEAWSSSTDIMSTSIDTVTRAVNAFTSGAATAFQSWQKVVEEVEKTTGKDFNSMQTNITAVTNVSDALAKSLTGENGVIDQLKTGFGEVASAITTALGSLTGLTVKINSDGTVSITDGISSSADGGYTGAWGPEGKIGILHEKEMILTQDETNQFFKHLNMMETILSTLDLYAASQQFGGILASSTAVSAPNNSVDQNVHIEASFPSVTDRNEIEEAFNNLVNKASQYANRQ